MKSVPLTAYPRVLARRPGAKKLRESGRVPAIIYGRQAQPQNLEIRQKEIEDLIHHSASENVLVDLSVPDDPRAKRLALVREVQHHPLSGRVLHVDLHEVMETEKVTVSVPVEAVGEAAGVKNSGGVLEHVMFKIRVRGLPKDLPEVISVDVSSLEIGHAVHLGEIKPPPGVEFVGDKNLSVLAVAAPVTEEQEAAAAEAEPAALGDVEMIKEKKEEGAEGEAPPAKGAAAKGAAAKGAPAKGAEKAAPAAKGVEGKASAPATPAAGAKAPGAEGKPKK
jgi:large subunit ribosomal protein L25